MAILRLDKFLADCGQGTRTTVKTLVRQGVVCINGTVVKKADIKIDTEKDEIIVNGKKVQYEEFSYYMLHKPAGVVSATVDNQNKTVIELITEEKRRDLFPVGRLDKDTEGLLIITNDGPLANKLLAPGKHVDKTYFVRVDGNITEEIVKHFAEGVDIGDDKLTAPAKLEILSEHEANITITEGRYHQIKRMFEAVEMEVTYLKRLSMGALRLDENLECGSYRKLTAEELKLLQE